MSPMPCGPYLALPLRAELLAAHEAQYATNKPFAYAVCRMPEGQAWEVNVRMGNIDIVLDLVYADHEAAVGAGAAWLMKQRAQGAGLVDRPGQ